MTNDDELDYVTRFLVNEARRDIAVQRLIAPHAAIAPKLPSGVTQQQREIIQQLYDAANGRQGADDEQS